MQDWLTEFLLRTISNLVEIIGWITIGLLAILLMSCLFFELKGRLDDFLFKRYTRQLVENTEREEQRPGAPEVDSSTATEGFRARRRRRSKQADGKSGRGHNDESSGKGEGTAKSGVQKYKILSESVWVKTSEGERTRVSPGGIVETPKKRTR